VLFSICIFSQKDKDGFIYEFNSDSCTFSSTGQNKYFILEIGYRIVLESESSEEQLIITVLDETRIVNGIETRVVEERESKHGELKEISRNFFAICNQTGDVFYFGEEVDIYKKGKVVKHSGEWLAEGENKPGLIMPGSFTIGYKYYQEYAPGEAMDKSEIISISETYTMPAGKFINCLKTRETTPLNLKEIEYKHYAPGIGIIQDEDLLLVKYGYIK
jgi:hypothetical protein